MWNRKPKSDGKLIKKLLANARSLKGDVHLFINTIVWRLLSDMDVMGMAFL